MPTTTKKSIKTYNLVLGIGGPYGAGSSSLAEELAKIVNDWPGCIAKLIHVSEYIETLYQVVIGRPLGIDKKSSAIRRKELQKAGTFLRQKIDPEVVGRLISSKIFEAGKDLEKNGQLEGIKTIVFIVDSLKNRHDLNTLKRLYTDEFYFIFVHAYREIRWRRMVDYKSWKENERRLFEERDLVDRDEKEINRKVKNFGQQVGKLSALADYYIVNDQNRETLGLDGERFIKILFGGSLNQPTNYERSMHIAYASANRSFCISRQVGAAIVDKNNNIIGVGHNDAPKANGGLYTIDDEIDKRCYLIGDRRCINDTNKEERFDELAAQITKKLKLDTKKREKIKKIIEESPFQQATEYCRAVHAEMEALLCSSRSNTGSTLGATMYVTTEPCHNCTKHLICAGIKKVIFMEPYPKSLGMELHSDSILLGPDSIECLGDKVCFYHYQGVAPHRYHHFFAKLEDRKDDSGRYLRRSKDGMAKEPKFAANIMPRSRTAKGQELDLITSFELQNVSYIGRILKGKSN